MTIDNERTTDDARHLDHHSAATRATDDETTAARSTHAWRVVDIVVAAVLGVALGLVFWAWNSGYKGIATPADALTPGLGGLSAGIWFLGGIVGGLVIRKPGAAILVEVIAASVSATIGSAWGSTVLVSGLLQGLGAELAFLVVLYRRFTLPVAVLAGALSAPFEYAYEWFSYGVREQSAAYKMIYLAAMTVSGAIAGVIGWLLVRALAKAGALNQFAVGREARHEV